MKNSCGWRFRDPENLGAPVDYHEVRGHLRLGTVIVEEPALLAAIRAEEAVDGVADLALRGAVASAISLIARTTGRSPSDLHYLFWNVFRNCCSRAAQHCSICPSACGLPLRYRDPSAGSRVCLFSSTCASAGRADKLIEHVHETDFY